MFKENIAPRVLTGLAIFALTCDAGIVHAQSYKIPMGTPMDRPASMSTGDRADSATTVSTSDRKMMRDLAYANLAEVEAGKLAQSKTQNEQVKSFAQRMVDDHNGALQDLQQLAQSKGVVLPTAIDGKHRIMISKLNNLNGDAFDRQYMSQGGVSDHQAAHRLLQHVQSAAKDPDLKQLAARTLPTVDQHLNLARQLHAAVNSGINANGTSTGSGEANTGAGTAASTNDSSKDSH